MGKGSVSLNRKIYFYNSEQVGQVQLACNGSVQSLHILNTVYDTPAINKATLLETYSQINTSTGESVIHAAHMVDNFTQPMIGYFATSGGSDFEAAFFANQSGSFVSAVGKTENTNNQSNVHLEYAISTTGGVNLDTLAFGDANERLCVYNYKTGSPTFNDISCDPTTPGLKLALIPTTVPAVGRFGARAWNTSYLNDLDVTDLRP